MKIARCCILYVGVCMHTHKFLHIENDTGEKWALIISAQHHQ